jgi:long-chain acyl-CoA synthetase
VIVVADDPALTEEGVVAHCRQHLTAYKVPSQVAFHPGPLPKTGLGKVMRRALRAPAGQGGPA